MTPDSNHGTADIDAQRQRYWLRVRFVTVLLLCLWFGMTFASAYHADALNEIDFLGFPLGFYLGAQGNLLGYLLIVGIYARLMNRLDKTQADTTDHEAVTLNGHG